MREFLVQRWFLLALLGVVVVGTLFATNLAALFALLPVSWENFLIAAMMFLMALPLEPSAVGQALRRPHGAALAVAASFLIAPLIAWAIAPLLGRVYPDLGYGLVIAAAVPTTVASAAVWTRRAGGNDAVALLAMFLTNVACFVVTPTILWLAAGAVVESERFQPGPMMVRLALIVALPLVAAQVIRLWPPVAAWSLRRKIPLGVVCQLGMLTMVLAGVVQCGEKLHGLDLPHTTQAGDRSGGIGSLGWLAMIAAVLAIHVTTLVIGQGLGRMLRLPRADWIAVGFAGSQKTLLVGLGIALGYSHVFGPLAVLPMVVYHVAQLLVDTLIADRLRMGARRGCVVGE